jgi:hypothetical protein
MSSRRARLTALCVLAVVCLGAFSGCGKVSNKPGETVGEGLSTPLGGLRYTVFITRQLNLAAPEDRGYVPFQQEAPPGHGLYGVFLQACNESSTATALAASNFYIQDAQGNRFSPVALSRRNPFAFQGGPVPPQNCEPRRGSLAQQGPTSGSLLLFNLPNAATENRPLELHIQNPAGGSPAQATVILDI